MSGGVPPYDVQILDSKLVSVTDSLGCEINATFLGLGDFTLSATLIRGVSRHHFSDGVGEIRINAGKPPFTITWNHRGPEMRQLLVNSTVRSDQRVHILGNLLQGEYDLTVKDSMVRY